MLNSENKKVSISVTTCLEDKQKATEIFDELGLSLSTAINIFIKKSIAEGGLPFDVKDPFYDEANQKEHNRRFQKINDEEQ